jgi:hypothetical protein
MFWTLPPDHPLAKAKAASTDNAEAEEAEEAEEATEQSGGMAAQMFASEE